MQNNKSSWLWPVMFFIMLVFFVGQSEYRKHQRIGAEEDPTVDESITNIFLNDLATRHSDDLYDFIATTAEEGNKYLPMTVDSETTMVKVTASGPVLKGDHVLNNFSAKRATELIDFDVVRRATLDKLCADTTSILLFRAGAFVQHDYYSNDGVLVKSLSFSSNSCDNR